MKKIALYFGDVFWCTAPYAGLQLFYELSKEYDVIPIFMKNDIRLHKKWNGNERFYFDVEEFRKIPYIEVEKTSTPGGELYDLYSSYYKHEASMLLMSCQMQFKGPFAYRNRCLRDNGIKIGMWDVGGCDALYVPSSVSGWSCFFSKGEKFKKHMINSSDLGVPGISMEEDGKTIMTCGTPDFDEIMIREDVYPRATRLDNHDFCSKYSLDPNRPIVAYVPANPRPDNSYRYPSGVSAREALQDINIKLLELQNKYGYQVCFKTHPGDYIDYEDSMSYAGVHGRATFGGYSGPRYLHAPYDQFTTISAEDGFNLYRNCSFGVTNYSHAGYELFLCKKPVVSYRMTETPEWKFVDDLCDMTYTDIRSGDEMLDVILNSRFKNCQDDETIGGFFHNIHEPACKSITANLEMFIDE